MVSIASGETNVFVMSTVVEEYPSLLYPSNIHLQYNMCEFKKSRQKVILKKKEGQRARGRENKTWFSLQSTACYTQGDNERTGSLVG